MSNKLKKNKEEKGFKNQSEILSQCLKMQKPDLSTSIFPMSSMVKKFFKISDSINNLFSQISCKKTFRDSCLFSKNSIPNLSMN